MYDREILAAPPTCPHDVQGHNTRGAGPDGIARCEYCGVAMYRERSADDPVNRPTHYTRHPSGVECIQIAEHMGFNLGNALKYIWRADLKGDAIEDLRKAAWYVQREIARRGGAS